MKNVLFRDLYFQHKKLKQLIAALEIKQTLLLEEIQRLKQQIHYADQHFLNLITSPSPVKQHLSSLFISNRNSIKTVQIRHINNAVFELNKKELRFNKELIKLKKIRNSYKEDVIDI
ncbi:hypothetical protein UA32_16165 [Photobacterium angustum]|uniref:hypothetical protein n=1 Tax=Photobacterium angustum TaxID=661 RepID=UPI0005E32C5F|nr:hypothetical protein [Photobacterium angustum]KJG36542.1 hypothetical protein UA32_16165 [Photobacterium angustum]